jgi:hypothetical protein
MKLDASSSAREVRGADPSGRGVVAVCWDCGTGFGNAGSLGTKATLTKDLHVPRRASPEYPHHFLFARRYSIP